MFPAHGITHAHLVGDLVITRAYGAFNLEGVQLAAHKVRSLVNANALTQWRLLECFAADTLLTPDAERAVRDFYLHAVKMGCCELALVCQNALQRQLAERILETVAVKCQFFDCFHSAKSSLLFEDVTDSHRFIRGANACEGMLLSA